jgi:hypothetical protein
LFLLTGLNGLIRIKVLGFKKSCLYFNFDYKEPDYNIGSLNSYFLGLIDTEGSIIFNFSANRIECNLEFKDTKYARKLNFDNRIPYCKPYVLLCK